MEYIQADIWVRFQRMQGHELHFVGADDAHGAPIMLKAEAEGITPAAAGGAHRRRAAALPAAAFTSASITGGRPTRPRTPSSRRRSTARLQAGGPDLPQVGASSSTIRSRACSCRIATSRANARTATPRTSTGTPARCAAPSTRPPSSSTPTRRSRARSPSCAARSISSSASRIRSASQFLTQLARRTRAPAAGGGQQGARVAERQRRAGARATGTSRAMRPTSASRSRMRRGSTSTCGWMRRSATSPRSSTTSSPARPRATRRAAQLRGIPRRPGHRADPLHRQGHHLLPHAVLAGDAEVRGRPVQGARSRVRARLHHRLGREDVEVARHRHQPAALPRSRHERRVAALLHRRQAQRQRRGPRLQPRGLHRARQQRPRSASTSTSPAAPRASSIASSAANCSYGADTAALQPRARAHWPHACTSATRRASSARRMREVMAYADRINQRLRRAPALGARQGRRPRPRSCRTSARARSTASRCCRCCSPRCCRRSRARAARELFGLDADFTLADAQVLPAERRSRTST